MIEAEGTQKDLPDPRSLRRFVFDNVETLSKVPLFVALFLTAVVAYLKSAMPAAANPVAEPEKQAGPRPDENSAPPMDAEPAAQPREGAALAEVEEGQRFSRAEPLDFMGGSPSGGNVIEFQPRPGPGVVMPSAYAYRGLPVDGGETYSSRPVDGSYIRAGNDNSGSSGGGTSASDSGNEETPPDDGKPGPGGQNPPPGGGNAPPPDDDDRRTNRAPTVSSAVRLNDVIAAQVVLIGLSELLENAADLDGDMLSITGLTVTSGTVVAHEAFWVYTPAAGYVGQVQVRYSLSDGLAAVAQVATFDVVPPDNLPPPTTIPTAGPDWIVLSDVADVVNALTGNDLIETLGGDDVIHAGDGDDVIRAGAGDDVVFAGAGNDEVMAGIGDDEVHGEADDDTIAGEEGDDQITGDDGRDVITGDAGNDVISGGRDDDMLSGGVGDDVVAGDMGNDNVSGDAGDDDLDGGAGTDSLFGGDGDDAIDGGAGNDYVEAGQGADSVDAGTGDDVVMAGEGADTVDAGTGDDVVLAGEGDDVVDAGEGSDTVMAEGGHDLVIVTLDGDGDVYDGGDGADALDMSGATVDLVVDLVQGIVTSVEVGTDAIADFEEIVGGSGDDTFEVGSEAVTMTGGEGNDTFAFAMAAPSELSTGQLIHQIIDFMVGDRILVQDFEITRAVQDGADDLFDQVYNGAPGMVPIRIRHERFDDMDHTVVDVDFDRNGDFEMSIDIYGHHEPYVYDNGNA